MIGAGPFRPLLSRHLGRSSVVSPSAVSNGATRANDDSHGEEHGDAGERDGEMNPRSNVAPSCLACGILSEHADDERQGDERDDELQDAIEHRRTLLRWPLDESLS